MSRIKVILYHKNCTDGLFSAYACWLKFGNEAVYIPVNYKPIQDLPVQEALDYIFSSKNVTNHVNSEKCSVSLENIITKNYSEIDLYVVDYSFPVEHFLYHIEVFNSVIVLDHHDTAIKAYTKNVPLPILRDYCVFSDTDSGAKLTFKYLFPNVTVPGEFELVSDRDLWTFNSLSSKPFHAGLKLYDIKDFYELHKLLAEHYVKIINEGKIVLRELDIRIKKMVRSSVTDVVIEINGTKYNCGLINTYPDIVSDLCSSMNQNGYDIAIGYYINKDSSVGYSVRSLNKIDSSLLSLAMGGGGHKSSSGFSSDLTFLSTLLSNKYLEINYNESSSIHIREWLVTRE